MTTTPDTGAERVRLAFRTGWAVSELRGRYRPDRFEHPIPRDPTEFGRSTHELPLGSERSFEETRLEVLRVLGALIGALGLGENRSIRRSLGAVSDKTWHINSGGIDGESWDGLADLIFTFDARLQDALLVDSSAAAAYQLGRGLADTYWALELKRDAAEMGSWECVLGHERGEVIERLTLRLSPYFGPQVLAAVTASLASWVALAADPDRRDEPGVQHELYRQGLLWHDLVCGERLPGDLRQREVRDIWRQLAMFRRGVMTLGQPLLIAGLGAAAFTAGAALLASGVSATGWATASTVVGGIGVTSASLYARAKADLTSIFQELREAVVLERVRHAADYCPTSAVARSASGR